jgi:uncharacterized repeat protein (TIGR01451 family)
MFKATKSFRFIVVSVALALFTSTLAVIGQDVAERINPKGGDRIDKKGEPTEWVATGEVESATNAPELTDNYVFATNTSGTFTDMTGSTQSVAAGQDDTAGPNTPIGFEFWLNGVRYTQFNATSNGMIALSSTGTTATGSTYGFASPGTATTPLISAMGGDLETAVTTGKVHYKVTGAAPNRVLTVEFLNMSIVYNNTTPDGTFQVRLYETTGQIEFVYGSMSRGPLTGAGVGNGGNLGIGFSAAAANGSLVSIVSATNTATTTTPFTQQAYATGPIANLDSPTDGSRRVYSLTPPVPTAPTGLNFTGVAPTGMTLNWTDSADEQVYAIYRSTDGINYSFVSTAVQNATSFAASGLNTSTNYFWQVYAVSEGGLSTALAGSQATTPPGNITSLGTGNWSSPGTWSTGNVPTAGDNVTIANTHIVTIDSSNALSVTVQSGGTLQFEQTTARTLTVGLDVTIDAGGTFQSNSAGTQTGHVVSIGGNLVNNGTIDFSTNANTAGAGITFTGAADAAFTLGAASTTDLKQTAGVTLNKGTNNTPVLSFNPGGTITVLGANTAGFLTITNGTFKMDGTGAFSNPLFTGPTAYTIPSTGGLWMNNPNANVVGLGGSPTLAGLLRMTAGTLNIGTGTGNSMGFSSGANLNIEGGSVNATGRFGVAASANAITYNQTGGTITTCTIGNASTTLACFDLGTGVGTANISAGNIVIQNASTAASGPRDYRHQSGLTGTTSVTGGTVQFGNAATAAAIQAFDVAGVFPNVIVDNTTAAHTVTMLAPAVFNNVTRNVTTTTGTTFNVGNNVFLFNGTTFTNNGTLTANGASSNFVWFNASAPVSYTGTGVTTAPITNFAIQADMGLTLDPAVSNIVVRNIRNFSGNLINSNKITLGLGDATANAVQVGNTTTPTACGTFDVPFTFNLGAGGQTLSYLRCTLSRSTGGEVGPTRSVNSMTYDDNDITHTLTIAGGDLTVTGATTLTNGRVITGANTLISGSAGTVTRTTGYVDGNFRKVFAAAANKTFEVGTANGYSPVAVNMTAATFPANFTVKAVQTAQPNIPQPAFALSRYWSLSGDAGVTADLTFNYLDPTDIPGTATEANFVIQKYNAGFTQPGGTVNAGANTATITGVSAFSDWTLAEPAALVAVEADLSITKTDGSGTATPGTTVSYALGYSNAGPAGVTSVVLTETVPAGSTFNAGASTAGWVCAPNNNAGSTCTLAVGAVANGGSGSATFAVNVGAGATGTLVNTASISSELVDPNGANNSATDTDTLVGSADLAITKTDGVTSVTAGGSTTYTITASNAGPSDTTATIADTFPAAYTASWTCVGAAGGTCTAGPTAGNINDAVTLPVGGSVTYTVTGTISASATGTLVNTATVTGAANDPTPGNNSATDTDMITTSADLGITKTDGVAQYLPGGTVTYTITASNAGPSNVTSASIVDNFPAQVTGVTWTCVGAGGGTCNANGVGNINETANLPSGGSVTYTAIATISGTATGSMANTATVSGGAVTDPTPGNNSATDTDTLAPASVQFSAAMYTEDESQTANIVIRRTIDTSGTSTVMFSAAAGGGGVTGGASCATPGVDFETVTNQLVTFMPTDAEKTVTVVICGGDTVQEVGENIALSLTAPTNAGLGSPATATLNINDTASQYLQSPVHTPIDMFFATVANPYPSQINVTGAPMLVGTMRVTLYDVSQAFPDNMDVLLVGPLGQKYLLVADTGGPGPISPDAPVTLTFSDFAGGHVPDSGAWTTGQFLPTVCETNTVFAPTAPGGPYVTPNCSTPNTLAQTMFGSGGTGFGLTNPNGLWSLYVRDDAGQLRPIGGDAANFAVGSIAGGWGLEFLAPTAADVSIGGRVLTGEGRGIRGARVTVTGNSLVNPITVTTGVNGRYTIPGLTAGETYVVTVSARRFFFEAPSRVITLNDNVADADFTGSNGTAREEK